MFVVQVSSLFFLILKGRFIVDFGSVFVTSWQLLFVSSYVTLDFLARLDLLSSYYVLSSSKQDSWTIFCWISLSLSLISCSMGACLKELATTEEASSLLSNPPFSTFKHSASVRTSHSCNASLRYPSTHHCTHSLFKTLLFILCWLTTSLFRFALSSSFWLCRCSCHPSYFYWYVNILVVAMPLLHNSGCIFYCWLLFLCPVFDHYISIDRILYSFLNLLHSLAWIT